MRKIRDCNVAVVGGAGFLGSHLTDHLVEGRGCKVTVIDNLCAGRREFVHRDARFIHADIADSESFLFRIFKTCGIDFVFQYAAWPYIPDSFERPLQVFAVNATGALHVINAAQEAGCEGILQVSSAEIYGEGKSKGGVCYACKTVDARNFYCSLDAFHEGSHKSGCGEWRDDSHLRLSEMSPVVPHSSYGAAKAAIDAMVQVRWREAKTPCIALRQFNCVGERETHPYVVPEIISQLSATDDAMRSFDDQFAGRDAVDDAGRVVMSRPRSSVPIIKLGNNSFRDFQYAGDAVRMAVELLERGQFGEVYNMGSESGVKIYDLAKLIGKVMGFADVRVEEDEARKRPWEIWHLCASNDKLKAAGVEMRVTPLEEALRRTVAWFEQNGRRWPWEK